MSEQSAEPEATPFIEAARKVMVMVGPREEAMTWCGYLADDNAQFVFGRIKTMLTGRSYSFVHNNVEQKHTHPEVRTGRRLTDAAPSLTRIGDEQKWGWGPACSCYISCSDSYGVWGIDSPYRTEREASLGDKAGKKDITHLFIEGGRGDGGRRERIEVSQYNGYGEMIHWVIAVEPLKEG